MNGKLLVMCASRGRPGHLENMLASVERTSTKADVVVYVDDDQRQAYEDIAGECRIIVGPRIGQCASLNQLWKRFPDYEAYGLATDDCTFEVQGWDDWVIKAKSRFRGGIGAIAPFSNSHVPRMDFPWVTAEWAAALGSFCLIGTYHDSWDIALQLVGEATQIEFAAPTDFRMVHAGLTLGDMQDEPMSDVAKLMYMIYHVHTDAKTLATWAALERHTAIDKIKMAIKRANMERVTA